MIKGQLRSKALILASTGTGVKVTEKISHEDPVEMWADSRIRVRNMLDVLHAHRPRNDWTHK